MRPLPTPTAPPPPSATKGSKASSTRISATNAAPACGPPTAPSTRSPSPRTSTSIRGLCDATSADPSATHAATGIQGRGTEECKTNDATRRCGPNQIGIAIEIGRPNLGMSVADIQKITRAIARAGVHKIEPHNPIHSMIANEVTGDMRPEMLNEKVLSAIIEIQVEREQLRGILRTIREVAKEVDSVFCVDAFTMVGPNLHIPEDVMESIRAEGFTWRPNTKVNLGLGRAWE